MYYKKKTGRLIIVYSLAALAVMGAFLRLSQVERDRLRREAAVGCSRAFAELSTAVGELDSTLQKALCASSPSLVSEVCSLGYAHCAAAGQAIASLPYGNIELEHTAAFLTKAGDYMFYLARAAARGESLTEDERSALAAISGSATEVSAALSELTARLISGDIGPEELERAEARISGAEDSMADRGLAASFKELETELPEMPSLIYDGPFSEHIRASRPAALEGLEDVDEDGAVRAAAKFLDARPESLRVVAFRDGQIPVYVVTRQNGGEIQNLEVTRQGGRVIYFGTVRETSEGPLSPTEGIRTARLFLEDRGYRDMVPTYHTAEGGELTVSFAWEKDGVICYPDLVKVTLAEDTGAVTGLEAHGYLSCHRDRELALPAFDTEAAAVGLSPLLTVKSHRPALIPTAGKNEVMCEEYLCQTPEGRHVLVYLNGETGLEEKILLLIESGSGTLTV